MEPGQQCEQEHSGCVGDDLFDISEDHSADKLHQPRSVAYSAEQVLLNKHQISGGGACPHCYSIVQRVAVVKPGVYDGGDNCFGGVKVKVGTDKALQ